MGSLADHLELADAVSGAVNVTGTCLGGDESSSRHLKKSYDKPRLCIKKRDITLPTKVHLVKAMVFPVVMYGCES